MVHCCGLFFNIKFNYSEYYKSTGLPNYSKKSGNGTLINLSVAPTYFIIDISSFSLENLSENEEQNTIVNCLDNCPIGYYADLDLNICKKCYKSCRACLKGGNSNASNCETCNQGPSENSTNCLSCKEGYTLYGKECRSNIYKEKTTNEYVYKNPGLNMPSRLLLRLTFLHFFLPNSVR